MLSDAENKVLTQTGPGTLMGNLFRRFWLPALKLDELPGPDCPPIRFRILSEDLIAFRATDGQVGFVANACPHRGASMFFGRNEEQGLRCVYHGWKFDIEGTCVDMPSEPAESNFKSKVRIQSYPAAEWGGLIWIYMGPPEKQPELPQYEFCLRADQSNYNYYKWAQESNYAQSLEGNIDTAHVGFLHRRLDSETMGGQRMALNSNAPVLQLMETDFGFVYGGRRNREDGDFYWRVTPFVLPTFTSIPNPFWGGGGIFVVPQDDEHCWWWTISEPQPFYTSQNLQYIELIPGTWRQTRNKDNDYLIDREKQRTENYTGLPTNRVQDAAVTESMGVIYDRSHEHLGTSDQAIIFMRRHLLKLARQLERGIEPPIMSDASLHRVRPVNLNTAEPNLRPVWHEDHSAHLHPEEAVATPGS